MKYFLHDSNSFQDDKITELYINFGYEGLGLFYTILEKIALQEKPIKTIVLKKQLNVKKRLEKCWNFLEEIELIYSKNGETFNENILKFSEKYQIKKEKNRKKISDWRNSQQDTKNVTSYEPVRNPPKDNISKDNISKVNKEKDKKKVGGYEFKNFNPEIIYPFESKEFFEKWDLWYEFRKEKRLTKYKKIGEQTALKQLGEMSGQNEETAIKIIMQSIGKGWTGLYELKNNNNGNNKKTAAGFNDDLKEEIFKDMESGKF